MSTWEELKNNPRLKQNILSRAEITKALRVWFWQNGFTETDTPLAVRYPGQEPYLNPVNLKLHNALGEESNWYLHTSPEFFMKKLLAAGLPKIFQITKTFRDHESFGGSHNPEFTMLEWYRSPGTLTQIMDDTEALIKSCAAVAGAAEFGWNKKTSQVNCVWDRVNMRDLWQSLNINLDDNLTRESLAATCLARGYQVNPSDAYEDLFFKIFLNEIEPKLGIGKPIFVYDYPAQMCSLSKLSDDARYAERFELYICGLEIANAFGELLDPKLQKTNLTRDQELRKQLGKPVWEVDPDFIKALESGIVSPSAGIALGVDRVVVLFTKARDLNEVIFGSAQDQLN